MTANALAARSGVRARPQVRALERAGLGATLALAATLRLVALDRTPLDPFYDAAVRSMGTSWHAFFVGAFDPSAQLAIDKPPLDLWLQVASTKLFGFAPFALLLPAALGGIVAVWALYDLLRTLAGPRVALAGALALALMPMELITSRSDTMDSVMAALLVGAFAVAARGLERGTARHAVAAGALVGLAFEVKLFEALVAAPPLALMWWFGARGSSGARARAVAAAAGAAAVTGLAWLIALTVAVPAAQRPWAFGSSNGSAWNAVFVYDGLDRLTGKAVAPHTLHGLAAAEARLPAAAGPWRLLSGQDGIGPRLGIMLACAWLAIALLAATRAWRPLGRASRAGVAALVTWLAIGTVLFSVQSTMRPRYLEAFEPAVAACLAIGVVLAARAAPRLRTPAFAGFIAVLAISLSLDLAVISTHVEDSGTVGALPGSTVTRLSDYLRAAQGGARYELASEATSPAAALIVRDARPVLILTAAGHQVTGTGALPRLVASGQVRDVLLSSSCRTAACTRLSAWVRAHGTDVSAAAGTHPGSLYAVGAP